MESVLGLLRIRIVRGKNLAVRDLGSSSSDPFVVITTGNQKLRTRVVKNSCNPEWNEELTLSISDVNTPIHLTVFDKDTFTSDDKMGEAEFDIKAYVEALRMGLQNLPSGCVISRVQPSGNNCLSNESCIVFDNRKLVQHICLRLKNVECGEVDVQLEWIDVPGSRGLGTEGTI